MLQCIINNELFPVVHLVKILTTNRPCQTANRLIKCKDPVSKGTPMNGKIATQIIQAILRPGSEPQAGGICKVVPVTAQSMRGQSHAKTKLIPIESKVTVIVNVIIPSGITKNKK